MILMGLALAQTPAPSVRGFAELRASWAVGADGTPWQLVQRFRPTFDAPLGDRILLSTTVEAGVAEGRTPQTELQRIIDGSDLAPLLELAGCEWPTDDNTLFHTNDAGDYLSVDRLTLDIYEPAFDLRVGRQALQWGSALFVNFTDPFPQVLFTEPWKPRAGVNSARLTVPIGEASQIQAVVGANDDFTKTRLAARGTVNALQTDWSLIGAWRDESDEVLTGLDIKGTLGVGFWLESALHVRGISEANPTLAADLAVGADYSVPVLETLYVAAQYMRNGTPAEGNATLSSIQGPECLSPTPFDQQGEPDPFAPFLSGTHYALLTTRLGVHPNVNTSATWLQNLGDGTAFVIPSVAWALPKQFDLSLTAQIPARPWGDGGEFSPKAEDLVLAVPDTTVAVDLGGLVPDATLVLWTRKTF